MKIFSPLFLGALVNFTSSSFLFAQAQKRLEATNQFTGCRLQVTGINQGAEYKVKDRLKAEGYRLEETENQSTDCRVQDKNRLKATNQVAGYRLQVVGPEAAELLSDLSFQISQ